ncbi:helix-hairpin-helix domain-containing protein [Streptococcus suis]|nr:helix-hairpin-helix domain-containing protein [Streptococcus suis]
MEHMIEIIKEYKWQLSVSLGAIVVIVSFLWFSQPVQSVSHQEIDPFSQVMQTDSSQEEVMEQQSIQKEESDELVVDVKGAVVNPGLYTLSVGSRLNDAVEAAGGFTSHADPKSVNLAQKLTDEAVVYVASQGEDISVVSHQNTNASSSLADSSGKVNLNTATEAELQTISGIGAKRAADIVAYRQENGLFKTVDELNNVSGIGAKTMETLRAYVTVD